MINAFWTCSTSKYLPRLTQTSACRDGVSVHEMRLNPFWKADRAASKLSVMSAKGAVILKALSNSGLVLLNPTFTNMLSLRGTLLVSLFLFMFFTTQNDDLPNKSIVQPKFIDEIYRLFLLTRLALSFNVYSRFRECQLIRFRHHRAERH